MKRKICIVTGTRAEYGIMKSLIQGIAESPSLDLQIVATGTHTIPDFGYTINDIRSDGFLVDAEVPMIVSGNSKHAMASSIGVGILTLTQTFSLLKPDIVVVLGDRFEILSASIAASYSGHVLAHLSGGDTLFAGYDEYTRHAITKIAHLHFPFTQQCADRIIHMGEDPSRVYMTGSPAIDTIVHSKLSDNQTIRQKYGLPEDRNYCLVIQHPISTSPEATTHEMQMTLDAVEKSGIFSLFIYPNADPGSNSIVKMIEDYVSSHDNALLMRSVPFEDYLALMKNASVMIGNSSSALLEAPSFGLPAINIGTRQKGREQGANIINVPIDENSIYSAILKAISDKELIEGIRTSKNPYGDGCASERIVQILEEINIDEELLQKRITY